MLFHRFIPVVLGLILAGPLLAQNPAPKLEKSTAIKVFLVDSLGHPAKIFPIVQDEGRGLDVIFRHSGEKSLPPPDSWALDINDPARHLSYRMALDGDLPSFIHWDGFFSKGESLEPGGKYYYRLILLLKDRELATGWSSFTTRAGQSEMARDFERVPNLILFPSMALEMASPQTRSSQPAAAAPAVEGNLAIVWRQAHTFGISAAAASTDVFQSQNSQSFSFSEFSLFYRYRLLGSPLRAPKPVPEGVQADASASFPSTNLELGAKIYTSDLSGAAGSALDADLVQGAQGLSAVLHADQMLGPLRLFLDLEGGYSVFGGQVDTFSGRLGLVYDAMDSLEPGVEMKYLWLGGPGSLTDRVLFAGLVLYFKT